MVAEGTNSEEIVPDLVIHWQAIVVAQKNAKIYKKESRIARDDDRARTKGFCSHLSCHHEISHPQVLFQAFPSLLLVSLLIRMSLVMMRNLNC